MAGDGANINYELFIPISKIDKTRGILVFITKEGTSGDNPEQYIIPLVPCPNLNGSYKIGGNVGYTITSPGRLENVSVQETTLWGVESIVVSCTVDHDLVMAGIDEPNPILWTQFDMPSAWIYGQESIEATTN